MAALAPGEHARMYAIGGVARGGATRGGYTSPRVFVSIGGIHYATGRATGPAQVDDGSLTITNMLAGTPNTCAMTVRGFVPADGQEVIVTLGTKNTLTREFGGIILSHEAGYVGSPANVFYTLQCIDYSWLAMQHKVSGRYTTVSASTIAAALVPVGFTGRNIQAGLPTIDTFSYTNLDVNAALTALAKRIGAYWYWDYQKDLHFFIDDTTYFTDPMPLTATHPTLTGFSAKTDLSQIVTRCFVEGGGVTCLAAIGPGETILPIEDAAWYPIGGGLVAAPNQRLTYAAAVPSGGGSFVGPGVAPSAAPTLAAAAGAGLGTGVYQYAYTDVTAAGESAPSPLGTITTGITAAPSAAPVATNFNIQGTGLDVGTHDYEVTFTTSAGETTPSPISGSVTIVAPYTITAPGTAPTTANDGSGNAATGWNIGDSLYTVITYLGGSGETTPSAASGTVTATILNAGPFAHCINVTVAASGDPNVTTIRVYIHNVTGGWWRYHDFANVNGTLLLANGIAGSPPGSNTAVVTKHWVSLSAIPIGGALVTGRKLYRRFNGTGTFNLALTFADNTTTGVTDTMANASLGAAAPSSNTATAQQVALSGVALGPTGTTSRKIYRTVVNGSQLKLQQTIANNTATVGVQDATADGSLGANAPVSDTSGLTQPTGQLLAGSITALLSGAAGFASTGGWALLAGQQSVRYTGITGNTLTGIPASGPGAIVASVNYGATAVALPCLTGIPASGPGSILYPILVGDPVNILAQVDDAPAQATLSALLDPGNLYGGALGIQEDYLTDGRIGYTEAHARGLAQIALRKGIDVAIAYTVQDRNSRAGKNVVVDLPAPFAAYNGTYKIQEVTQSGFVPALLPTYTVRAGSSRFTLEDLLRQVGGGGA